MLKILDTAGHPNAFKACPDDCTGTGFSVLEFARSLHGHLLETCDPSHVLK
jgi:hypothetical protein